MGNGAQYLKNNDIVDGFVFEEKNICYRYDTSGIKRKWTYDKEKPC